MIGWIAGKLTGAALPYIAGAALAALIALAAAVMYYRGVAQSRADEIVLMQGRIDALAATLAVVQSANRDLQRASAECTAAVGAFVGAADKARSLAESAMREAQASSARALGLQRKLDGVATQPGASCDRVRAAIDAWRAR